MEISIKKADFQASPWTLRGKRIYLVCNLPKQFRFHGQVTRSLALVGSHLGMASGLKKLDLSPN